MKSLFTYLGTVLLLGASASLAHAQYPFQVRTQPLYCPAPPLPAPDGCGPGFYMHNCYGQCYGPGYYVTPPFPPFQGMLPIPPGAQQARFPSHPYVRSPRDFFMID